MKPQIDAMFRRTTAAEHPVNQPSMPAPGPSGSAALPTPPVSGTSTPSAPIASSLLNAVASAATARPTQPTHPTPKPTPSPETSPLTLVTSMANFNAILTQHPAVIVNFTNTPTCPPCRAIKPVYETIAQEFSTAYGSKGARFVEVELSVGEGRDIAGRNGVTATPTFGFFRQGKKVDELRGASKRELEIKVEQFLEDTWPRHAHRNIYLAQLEGMPVTPIASGNVPNFAALVAKMESFGVTGADLDVIKMNLVPALDTKTTLSDQQLRSTVQTWSEVSGRLLGTLKPEETFPIIDLWRVALINPRLSALLAIQINDHQSINPIMPILDLASQTLKQKSTGTPKPFLLTVLRLLTNLIAALPLANLLLDSAADALLAIIVDSLLHPDNTVRSAAAGVAFNLSTVRHRDAKERNAAPEDGEEKEWEVELVSALVEAVAREEDEDVGEYSFLSDIHP